MRENNEIGEGYLLAMAVILIAIVMAVMQLLKERLCAGVL